MNIKNTFCLIFLCIFKIWQKFKKLRILIFFYKFRGNLFSRLEVFYVIRGNLFSRIRPSKTFRGILFSRKWPKSAKTAKINSLKVVLFQVNSFFHDICRCHSGTRVIPVQVLFRPKSCKHQLPLILVRDLYRYEF